MSTSLQAYRQVSASEDYRERERMRSKARHDEAQALGNAKRAGMEEGKAVGLVEGKAVGLAEGKAVGMVEGKAVGLVEGKAVGLAAGMENMLLSALKNKVPFDMVETMRLEADIHDARFLEIVRLAGKQ